MAGSKIRDDKQEYQYSQPFITPSGHEFSFYDTPDNQRLIVKHASGSHIEFKADGSVFIKAVKDVHTHSSVVSSQSDSERGADHTTQRIDTDYALEVGGRLKIKCSELDFEIGSTGRIIAGTDLIVSANNMINKATESISIEGIKSVYLDTKELRERVVSRQTEAGTAEDGEPGGVNILRVHGNALIRNDDPNGGITIASRGYLNLVCGQERVDITGRWVDAPSQEAVGTYTSKVFQPEANELSVSQPGGDYYFESESSAKYIFARTSPDPKYAPFGHDVEVRQGDSSYTVSRGNLVQDVALNRTRNVGGTERIKIDGIQTVEATKIFLN